MRDINAAGRLVSVELLPRDEESDMGGVRLELLTRPGILGEGVELRATVDSFCDDETSASWLRVGTLLDSASPGDAPLLCHLSGMVLSSMTDSDGTIHLSIVAHSVSLDVGIMARFPGA